MLMMLPRRMSACALDLAITDRPTRSQCIRGKRCPLHFSKNKSTRDDIRVAGRSVVGSGLPSQPRRNPDQAPHCRWTQSHGCATRCTVVAMLSLSSECYKACTFYPSLIQKHPLRTLSLDVLSTACCPGGIGSVSRSQCCVK